jgi:hypothetical protein
VAVREDEAALGANGRLDRLHGRPRIVPSGHDEVDRADQAVARRVGEERATRAEVDRGDGRLLPVPNEENGGDRDDSGRGGREEEEQGGPLARAAPLPVGS